MTEATVPTGLELAEAISHTASGYHCSHTSDGVIEFARASAPVSLFSG